ncbi:MAG TPA: 5-methyltetrahydropteroyltriglutamate--homocysteine S-methyltransferase [Xanthobacteraceae bacterium]|nr:5-methyltetrahydropteroyltriglutamate--homocysteine S-methyltransferase [Xanthobacteraceae bacterium]
MTAEKAAEREARESPRPDRLHPDGRPPFRADHVGSLLRPAPLRQAFRRHAAKEISAEEFRQVQDQCIRAAVRMQEEIGLKVVTDGEFRRASYWANFLDGVEGLGLRTATLPFRDDQGHQMEFIAPRATARLRRRQPIALDEFRFLRQATSVTPKVTLPSPSTMHFYGSDDFGAPPPYADLETFFSDLAHVYSAEIADLAAAGCRYVQIDEVAVALLIDPAIRGSVERAKANPDRLIDLYIDAINRSVARRPADMVIGVHVCRGNYKGHYLGQGGYEAIAERFFGRTDANHFLLEYDTARAGDFSPLRFVPANKGVVLGLVSSKTPALESLDSLRRRVDEATKHIALDRLAISPQCGFASSAAGNPLSEADQRAKLRRVVEAAHAIWR